MASNLDNILDALQAMTITGYSYTVLRGATLKNVVDIATTGERKRQSIACYASQFPATAPRPTVPERVAAADAWWGSLIGSTHGEPFWSREPVGLRGFDQLV